MSPSIVFNLIKEPQSAGIDARVFLFSHRRGESAGDTEEKVVEVHDSGTDWYWG